jgi:hypothetical protein
MLYLRHGLDHLNPADDELCRLNLLTDSVTLTQSAR